MLKLSWRRRNINRLLFDQVSTSKFGRNLVQFHHWLKPTTKPGRILIEKNVKLFGRILMLISRRNFVANKITIILTINRRRNLVEFGSQKSLKWFNKITFIIDSDHKSTSKLSWWKLSINRPGFDWYLVQFDYSLTERNVRSFFTNSGTWIRLQMISEHFLGIKT